MAAFQESNSERPIEKATTVTLPLYEEGWEQEGKHIFVLSESGKPIFSRYGEEQDMAATMGLISALIAGTYIPQHIRVVPSAPRVVLYSIHLSSPLDALPPPTSGARPRGLSTMH